MDDLLSIGRFSRLCGLSIGTLRHYHEVGLLVPAEVDPWNGFRRYSPAQLPDAQAIAALRELELPLDEVRAVLAARPADRVRLLRAYRQRIESRIWRYQRVHYRLLRLIEGEENLMAPQTELALDPETHRRLGASLFNGTWTLLEAEGRTRDQDDAMIHMAHASAHHWRQAGAPENFARSEWQCSRVYVMLGRAEPALWHARRCLEICEEHGIGDWDLGFAYEALARAHAVAGDEGERDRYLALAREASAAIAEEEDRELLLADLATVL